RGDRLDLLRRGLEEEPQQELLRQHAARRDAIVDPLVERALVRRVLVDDEEPLGSARQDEGLAVLADRDDVRNLLLGGCRRRLDRRRGRRREADRRTRRRGEGVTVG